MQNVPPTKGHGFIILKSFSVPQLIFTACTVRPWEGADERPGKVCALRGLWRQWHYFCVRAVITSPAYSHGGRSGAWLVVFPPLGWAARRGEADVSVTR